MSNPRFTTATAIAYWAKREPWQIELAKRAARRRRGELPLVDRRVKGRSKRP